MGLEPDAGGDGSGVSHLPGAIQELAAISDLAEVGTDNAQENESDLESSIVDSGPNVCEEAKVSILLIIQP